MKKTQTSQTQYTKNSQEMLEISDQQYYEEQRLSTEYSVATVDSNTIGTYYIRDYSNGSYFFREANLPDDYKASTTYYKFDGVNLTSEKVNDLYMAIRDNFMTGSVEEINELTDAFKFMEDGGSYDVNIAYLAKNLNNTNALDKKKSYVMNFLKEMWGQVGRTPLKSVYQATFKVLQSTNIDWAQEHIDPDGNVTYHENYPWYYAILLFLESIDIAIADRDAKIDKAQQVYDKLQAANIEISNSLVIENNFTEDQLIRLSAFIKEDELHIEDIIETEYDTLEDSFKVKQDAMEAGRIELSKRCQPQLQFSMTMANIYAIPEFEPIIHQFQLGKVIKIGLRTETKTVKFIGDGKTKKFAIVPLLYEIKNVSVNGVETTQWEYSKQTGLLTLKSYSAPKNGYEIEIIGTNNYIKQARLLQVDMGLDDLSDFQAQFGELTDLRSQSDIHADLLSQAIQAGKSVASSQDNWNAGVDMAISTDIKIQQGLLDATTSLKSIDGTQGVEVDKYGIHLRKVNPDTGEVDPKQGWITNNMMAYTDNNWMSAKSVFGEYTIKGESSSRWGLLADACIASYMEGSTIVGGKIGIGERDDGSYNFSVNYEGHMIAQSADVVGKITTSDITADGGTIGGFKITSSYLAKDKTKYDDTKDGVYVGTDGIGLGKNKFHVTASGKLTAEDATIKGKITTSDITATGGTIGGFTVTDKYIAKTKKSYNDTSSGVYLGTDGIGLGNQKFYVTSAGKLTATDATIKGKIETTDITATGGTIGGFTITSSYLAKDKKSYNDANDGVYIGTNGIGLGKGVFYAKSDGSVVANNISTNGIKATGGTIGGWTLSTEDIAGYSNTTLDNSTYRALIRKSSIGKKDSVVFGAGKKVDGEWTWPFYVDGQGNLYTNNATVTGTLQTGVGDAVIKGKIVATSGSIGGCEITGGVLYADDVNIKGVNVSKLLSGTCSCNATYTGSSTYTGGFSAGYGGSWTQVKGHIEATSGNIGGCLISDNHLWVDGAHIKDLSVDKISAGSVGGYYCSWQQIDVMTDISIRKTSTTIDGTTVLTGFNTAVYKKMLYLLTGSSSQYEDY